VLLDAFSAVLGAFPAVLGTFRSFLGGFRGTQSRILRGKNKNPDEIRNFLGRNETRYVK
jgi:hypothetical protein